MNITISEKAKKQLELEKAKHLKIFLQGYG